MKELNVPLECTTLEMMCNKKNTGLLSPEDVAFLSNAIVWCDEASNGMPRSEAVNLIMDLMQQWLQKCRRTRK